ncbi:MAG TPA: HAMP domain-containing sensor histidine kinase [Streptosporangiaceae bacterium]|nr:HAMP domain-containing sensor histidine kinase [Streptosporangiaceae bacterium]
MTRSRRLSLRARMLILLIAVTAIFLLIMGAVTTSVLSSKLRGQFNADLIAASARDPRGLADNTGGYLAVAVSVRTGRAVVITPGAQASELASALSQLSLTGYRQRFRAQPTAITLQDGKNVRAVARGITASKLETAGFTVPAFGAYVLVVAHTTDTLAGQIGGVVIAELITGAALLALLAIGGSWLIGRGLSPLDQMADTANEITSRGDLAARVADADEGTEVGRLGSAINTMLDRIQQAFGARLRSEQKVREFAADASHELRTPLTTIRGYAELYRQGALGPDQLPNAMRRIEQEAQRMSTLVAELLELARLDRTSSLDLTETDLAEVVRDAVADAAAVEPERPVRAEAPPRLVAVVDEPRIRQVLANLLANVRAHTPLAAPVAVRLGAVAGGVVLEVADAGPGMSADDAARAFDRFHRAAEQSNGAGHAGGPARASGDERGNGAGAGSGLGLSIVQAIAHAHGGQATLESWPGRGTRVRIWLPTPAAP